MKKKIVTGYIPIQGHPRSSKEYGELSDKIFPKLDCVGGNFSIHPFYETVQETWLCKAIQTLPDSLGLSHSEGDYPQKNSLAYHCVQHQKFGWLLKAAIADPEPETFVWMDFGIAHVPGVTADVVNEFMGRVRKDDFAIPGCWQRENVLINDRWPCWRFCGGLMVVPRDMVHLLFKNIKAHVISHMKHKHNLTWEVNSLARIEPTLPIRWYEADHNETMFTRYGEHHEGKSGNRVCPPADTQCE